MNPSNPIAVGQMLEKVREYYVERSALFGFIKWYEAVRYDTVKNTKTLVVGTKETPDKVFINNITYVPQEDK